MKHAIMQAIEVKYLAPTNTRGSRLKATAAAGSITVAFDYGSDCPELDAAWSLMNKLGWNKEHYGTLAGGVIPNGNYVFVMVKS